MGYNFELQKLQKNYDALLQMYGEKAEEAEELKLDLLDVKAMYRSQVMDIAFDLNPTTLILYY